MTHLPKYHQIYGQAELFWEFTEHTEFTERQQITAKIGNLENFANSGNS